MAVTETSSVAAHLPGPEAAPIDTHPYQRQACTRFIGQAALRLGLCLMGMGTGAATGGTWAFETPSHIALMPGVSVDASPSLGTTSEFTVAHPESFPYVDQLPANMLASYVKDVKNQHDNLYMPRIHAPLTATVSVSAHISLDGRKVNVAKLDSGALSDLLAQPVATIERPVVSGVTNRLLHDTETGGIIGALGIGGLEAMYSYRKYRQRGNQTHTAHLQWHHQLARWGALGIASLQVAACGGAVAASGINIPNGAIPVNQELVNDFPLLAGAHVSSQSTLSEINNAVSHALKQQRAIDAFYSGLGRNLTSAMSAWLNNPANRAALHDQSLVAAVTEGGLHCSVPVNSIIAPIIVQAVAPRLIISAGNIGFSAGNTPLDSMCADTQLGVLKAAQAATHKRVNLVMAPGSHDSRDLLKSLSQLTLLDTAGTNYHPFTPLDGKPEAIAGITFMGASTPRQNIFGQPTEVNGKPATPQQQQEALYQAGNTLADSVCKFSNARGVAPLLVVNSPEAAYSAMDRGCTGIVMAGEGPVRRNIYTARENSAASYLQVQQSAGGNGADCKLWLDETIDNAGAEFDIELLNPATNTVAYGSQIVISGKGTVAPIADLAPPPSVALQPQIIQQFLDTKGSYVQADDWRATRVGDPNAC